MLEARAKHSTTNAIRKLMGLQPKQVITIMPNGTERTKSIGDVKPGDVLMARPGERIAVDGVVTEGTSTVDESMLSGEPIPVGKTLGERVMAGTINKNGTLRYRAEKTATDTLLAHIVRMVQNAQTARCPCRRWSTALRRCLCLPSLALRYLVWRHGWCCRPTMG